MNDLEESHEPKISVTPPSTEEIEEKYPEEWQHYVQDETGRKRGQSIVPVPEEKASHVLILYTGGTIGMRPTPQGLMPAKNYLRDSLKKLPQFHDPSQPELTTPLSRFGKRIHYVIKEYETLLDSSNMSMEDWIRIAEDIGKNYDKYDSFIILHGTDTMTYTASALSFMLENLGKTVILTGSQVPLSQEPSDGVDNLLGSLTIAGHCEIPEVCIFFHEKLFRGNRTTKWDSSKLDAFRSPNYPPLASTGVALEIEWSNVLPGSTGTFRVNSKLERNVAILKIFPGITEHVIRNFLAPPVKGIVLETYGAGNAPSNRSDIMVALKEAIDRGVMIVNCTQCPKGTVLQTIYATGMGLNNLGVASGFNMTTTAALTELAYLLAQNLSPEEIKKKLQTNLRGELTPLSKEKFSFKDPRFIRSLARGLTESSREGLVEESIEKVLFPVLMCAAAGSGDLEEVKNLIKHGASVNQGDYDQRTPLHLAVSEGHTEVVKFLLEKGANPNVCDRWGGTPLQDAVRHKHYHLIQILTEKEVEWKNKNKTDK